MKPTSKNLLMLARLEERMQQPLGADEHYQGHPALTTYDLQPRERYHAERLVRLGFLKKTRSCAPWYGAQPVTLYYIDETCRANPFPYRYMQNKRMQERLAEGEAIDLSGCPRPRGVSPGKRRGGRSLPSPHGV